MLEPKKTKGEGPYRRRGLLVDDGSFWFEWDIREGPSQVRWFTLSKMTSFWDSKNCPFWRNLDKGSLFPSQTLMSTSTLCINNLLS